MAGDVFGVHYTCSCCGTFVDAEDAVHEGVRHWCARCSTRDDREECARDYDDAQMFDAMNDEED